MIDQLQKLFPGATISISDARGPREGFMPHEPQSRVVVIDNREDVYPLEAALEFQTRRAIRAENDANRLRRYLAQ